ncbi:unnamed protein product [Phytomonas sp. Hart1]|nr:unnamed protein product [Phytomonas sp. Hart1]|eukprot:CCW66695.1 unnamed protein product [Phytomonas sp. isolate Hart1]
MTNPTLWYVKNLENNRTLKVLALASFANVTVDHHECEMSKENETEFFAKNCHPCGRYPVLQTEEGFIFESNAIARHIARLDKSGNHLYGRTPFENSQVDMWLDFSTTELDLLGISYFLNFLRNIPVPEDTSCKLEEVMGNLDKCLENRTFLVGERMTAADVIIAFSLRFIYRVSGSLGEEMSKKYKNVFRLYNTIVQHPKMVEFFRELGTSSAPFKSEKPVDKKQKPAKSAPKPAAKKDDDEEEEEEVPKEKKVANPLDMLPPSSFVLDAFKREYSNTDTRTVAAPYFFDKFDASGYSCFWCRYKYNEENKRQFMTANLIRGWFQRMEHLRKYVFGVALIMGEESKHDIVGFWVFRGQGIPQVVEEVADTELFDWVPITDINAEKETITDYLCWDGLTFPLPILEGRTFK